MTTLHPAETLVRRFWELMARNDFHAVAEVLHPDFELQWPQSGERIRGAFNFGEVNRNYPAAGLWRFEVRKLLTDDNGAVTEVQVTDGKVTATAISFFSVRDGLIDRLIEYWPEPFDSADWRRPWVEAGDQTER